MKELEKKRYKNRNNLSLDSDSDDNSSSESEDEAAELLPLSKRYISNFTNDKERDPSIYDKKKSWYVEEAQDKIHSKNSNTKKQKVMTYKENCEKYGKSRRAWIRQRRWREGISKSTEVSKPKTYNQEQEDLRQAFITQANHAGYAGDSNANDNDNVDDDDSFLKVVKKQMLKKQRLVEMKEWQKTSIGLVARNRTRCITKVLCRG